MGSEADEKVYPKGQQPQQRMDTLLYFALWAFFSFHWLPGAFSGNELHGHTQRYHGEQTAQPKFILQKKQGYRAENIKENGDNGQGDPCSSGDGVVCLQRIHQLSGENLNHHTAGNHRQQTAQPDSVLKNE